MYRIRIPVYKDQVFRFFFPVLVNEFIFTLNQEASFKIVTGGTRVVTGGTCRKKFYQIKQIMDGSHKTCKFFVKAAMFFIN
jgi:hypothetical protein